LLTGLKKKINFAVGTNRRKISYNRGNVIVI
jgi:hypothetical protein